MMSRPVAGEEPHGGSPSPFEGCFTAPGREVCGGGVVDLWPASTAARPRMTASMVLPTPGGPMNSTLVASAKIGACYEFPNEFLVDAGLGGEVEVVELPGGGEVSESYPGVPSALLGGFDLNPEQPFEELGMANVVSVGVFEVAGESLSGGCGQLEVGEMTPELLVDRVSAHGRLWFCRSM